MRAPSIRAKQMPKRLWSAMRGREVKPANWESPYLSGSPILRRGAPARRPTVEPERPAMVETRIKPYREQVAEEARRAEQTRITGATRCSACCWWPRPFASGGSSIPIRNGSSLRLVASMSPARSRLCGRAGSSGPSAAGNPARSSSARAHRQRQDGAFAGSGRTIRRRDRQLRLGSRLSRHGPGHGQAHPEERARLPHHLIDVAEPDQPFTAGEYSRQARAACARLPLGAVCPSSPAEPGSTCARLPKDCLPGPRARKNCAHASTATANNTANGWLHRLLKRLDPASAARIHANDTPKLIRAIEVCLAARKPLSHGVNGPRSAHRLPPSAHRPEPAAAGNSMTASTAAPPHVCRRSCR